jgi:hypothetical protein
VENQHLLIQARKVDFVYKMGNSPGQEAQTPQQQNPFQKNAKEEKVCKQFCLIMLFVVFICIVHSIECLRTVGQERSRHRGYFRLWRVPHWFGGLWNRFVHFIVLVLSIFDANLHRFVASLQFDQVRLVLIQLLAGIA